MSCSKTQRNASDVQYLLKAPKGSDRESSLSNGQIELFSAAPVRSNPCADPERGQEPPPPPWKITKIGFLSNTGPDPLKNLKATKPEFNVGPSSARQQNTI